MDIRKGRPKSQVVSSGPSHQTQPHHSRRAAASLPTQQYRCYENDEEIHNERKRQIAELKTRMRQLEKTTRWWSDCATNWREKWNQLRIERNKYKEDLRLTQAQLEMANKELDGYRKGRITPGSNNGKLCTPTTPNYLKSTSSQFQTTKNRRTQTDQELCKSDDNMERSIYLLKLEESNRTIIAEREDKIILHQTVEKLQRELQDLQELYDNLKKELYELKDYSESAAEPDDLLSDEGEEEEEEECEGAVGYSSEYFERQLYEPPLYHKVNHYQNFQNYPYQSSLVIELPEKKIADTSPILQIVEESDDAIGGNVESVREPFKRRDQEKGHRSSNSPKNDVDALQNGDVNDDLFSVRVVSEEARPELETSEQNGAEDGGTNGQNNEGEEGTTSREQESPKKLNDLTALNQNHIDGTQNGVDTDTQHLNNIEEDLLKEYSILKKLDELNIANFEKEMNNESLSINNTSKIFEV